MNLNSKGFAGHSTQTTGYFETTVPYLYKERDTQTSVVALDKIIA